MRLPKALEKLADMLAARPIEVLSGMAELHPFVSTDAGVAEQHKDARAAAWHAFVAALYAKGHLRGFKLNEGFATPRRGRRVNAFSAAVWAWVEDDIVMQLRDFSMFVQREAAQLARIAGKRSGSAALVGVSAAEMRLWTECMDVLRVQRADLMPLAPHTYAAVVFVMLVDMMRREHVRGPLRKNLATLLVGAACAAAMWRCFGMRVTGLAEALAFRDLANYVCEREGRSTWWGWLVSANPKTTINQLDRFAALERFMFGALMNGWGHAGQFESIDGWGSGGVLPPIQADFEPDLAPWFGAVPGGSAEVAVSVSPKHHIGWLLASRAPQAAWVQARMDNLPSVPEGYEGDAGMLPPAANALKLEHDRFSYVLGHFAALCAGCVERRRQQLLFGQPPHETTLRRKPLNKATDVVVKLRGVAASWRRGVLARGDDKDKAVIDAVVDMITGGGATDDHAVTRVTPDDAVVSGATEDTSTVTTSRLEQTAGAPAFDEVEAVTRVTPDDAVVPDAHGDTSTMSNVPDEGAGAVACGGEGDTNAVAVTRVTGGDAVACGAGGVAPGVLNVPDWARAAGAAALDVPDTSAVTRVTSDVLDTSTVATSRLEQAASAPAFGQTVTRVTPRATWYAGNVLVMPAWLQRIMQAQKSPRAGLP